MKANFNLMPILLIFIFLANCTGSDNDEGTYENTQLVCDDMLDNDSDGYTDCDDQDCEITAICGDSGPQDGTSYLDSGLFFPESNTDIHSNADASPNLDSDMRICDEQGFQINPKPISIMLLLDRSSSMSSKEPSRWSQAVNSLTTLLSSWSNPYVSFGLDYFPDGSDLRKADGKIAECGVKAPVQIDCAPSNELAIINHLVATLPPPSQGYMTPMWCALNNFKNPAYAPGCNVGETEPYVVLISDGSDTCGMDCHCMDTPDTCGDSNYGASDLELSTIATALCANGVKTFVISFGGGAEYKKLNAITQSGCTELTRYLDAADGDALLAAFDTILDVAVPCEFEIAEPEVATDPNKVNFYFDETIQPNIGESGDCDSQNGWQWLDSSHTKMKFCGQACKDIKSGTVSEVKAKFGCKTVIMVV